MSEFYYHFWNFMIGVWGMLFLAHLTSGNGRWVALSFLGIVVSLVMANIYREKQP